MIWLWAAAVAGPLERGQFEVVVSTMNKVLEKHPGAPGPLARVGMAQSRAGRYREALATFEPVTGTAFYEARALEDHANALRGLGRCAEAAELRTSAAFVADEERQLALWVGVIDDWLECGDLTRAEDAVEWALVFDPSAPAVHAAWADVLRLGGDAAGAEYAAAVANRSAPTDPRVLLGYSRWCASVGDWRCVGERIDLLEVQRPRDPNLLGLHLQMLVGTYRWLEAGATCAKPEWAEHQSVTLRAACARARHPEGQRGPPLKGPPGARRAGRPLPLRAPPGR